MSGAGEEGIRATVVGAGSWGTALSLLLDRNGHDVTLWSYEESVVKAVRETGENPYLPGVPLPESVRLSSDLAGSLSEAELIVSVSPAQHVGAVMAPVAAEVRPDALVVSASKGIEIRTQRTMDEVLRPLLPGGVAERFCVISGPSFAVEVAHGMPTAVVVASRDREARMRAQRVFGGEAFRVYTNADVIGVELGGAVKNVIALAAGVAAGLGFGHNTLAALITRGLAEMTRLGVAMGARQETFSGLAGMGDLVLTCTGDLSRNRTVGFRLGEGESLDEILSDMTAVAEGVRTTPAVHALARRHGVEMPIVEEVHSILQGDRTPRDAVQNLMLRDLKPESWS